MTVSGQAIRRPTRAQATSRRSVGRAIAIVLLGSLVAGLAGAALAFIAAGWQGPKACAGPVAEGAWTARSRACFVPSGFYHAEFDPASEHHFSWTEASAQLRFSRLDRSRPHRLTLTVGAARPSGVALPTVRMAIDGVVTTTTRSVGDRQTITVDLPARSGVGATVTIDVPQTFVPGGGDTRTLGVAVDDVTLEALSGAVRPANRVLVQAALAVMLAAAGLFLCGIRVRAAAVASAVVAAAFAWLLAMDAAFAGDYVDRLLRIGAGAAVCGALIGLVASRWRSSAYPEWPVAAVILLAATVVKLAVFGHPLAQVGDAMFQVHRAQEVHAGRYFFTSITPKPFFEFPYPVALYVFAQPVWHYFRTELDLAFLLRGITLAADGLVGLGLYFAARRQWANGRMALYGALLWTVARAPLESVTYANLTNAFGQAVFGIAMGGVSWLAAGPAAVLALLLTCACLVVAFLSHFSTISIGLPTLGAAAAALLAFGKDHARRAAGWVLVLTLAAGGVSYGVYYSRFNPVYRQTLSRLLEGQKTPVESSKLVASPAVKLQRWWTSTGDDYGRPGVPMMAAAAIGAALLAWRRRREGLTIVLFSWMAVWVGLSALGVFSPVSMRMNLAAAPALVALAAYALGSLSSWSWIGAVLAGVAVAPIGWDALRVCFACLGRIPAWFIT
jgi:MYXO-CTERM domain-containing protein